MEFELYNRAASKVVWTHFYSHTGPVKSKAVPAVVEALDQNLDRGLNEVAGALSKYLAANPPGKSCERQGPEKKYERNKHDH